MGCHQSERRWLLDGLTPIGVPLPYIKTTERSLSIYSIGAIEDLETFDYSRLRRNFASVICEGQCKAFVVGHSLRPTALVQCEGDKAGQPRSKSRHKGVISTLLGLYSSSMSAKPPLKSLQPQWLAEEIRQQLLKAAGLYEDADVITE